jgi:hypothetical protein
MALLRFIHIGIHFLVHYNCTFVYDIICECIFRFTNSQLYVGKQDYEFSLAEYCNLGGER